MLYDGCVIEAQVPGCRWVLFRPCGDGTYFFIADPEKLELLIPQINLFCVCHNYFRCRSIAVSMYRAFVVGQGVNVRSPAPMNGSGQSLE